MFDDNMEPTEIGRGAEATIRMTDFYGRPAVVKSRVKKGYRHPDLDRHLRMLRTRTEVRVMVDARKAGVRSPVIYDVDLDNGEITMEFLEGDSVKHILDAHPERMEEICDKIGSAVAKLHNNRISHGDLTTSNMIMVGDDICMIDFSMGDTRVDIEQMGVDLRLLERAFTSAHSTMDGAFERIISSYRSEMTIAPQVLSKVEEIKGRARYT